MRGQRVQSGTQLSRRAWESAFATRKEDDIRSVPENDVAMGLEASLPLTGKTIKDILLGQLSYPAAWKRSSGVQT